MTESDLTLWEWLARKWNTPRWRKAVRLIAAGLSAAAGIACAVTDAGSGNWLPLLAGAAVFLILGLRIEVPEEPLPVIPDGFEQPPKAVAEPEAPEAGEIRPAGKGGLPVLRLPLAVAAAFLAQWIMDFRPIYTPHARTAGLFLYLLAFGILSWALASGDAVFPVASTSGEGKGFKITLPRAAMLMFAVFFGVLVYMGSSDGMFRPLALLTLAVALVYWWIALAEYSGGMGEALIAAFRSAAGRIRGFGAGLLGGITLSPWSLLVAACFAALVVIRTVDLAATPPEMTSDHIEKLVNVDDILQGNFYIFFANNGGREALEFYLVALVSQIFGTGLSFLSLKIVSVAAGILTLPFLYLLGREIADRRVGLLAMVLGGIGYWPDMISRIGLRLPLAMLFSAAALYFYFRALRRRRWNDFLWTGVVLGIGMYGYTPIRIVPLALAAVTLLFLLHPSSKGSRGWGAAGFAMMMATTVLLFVPFLRYAAEFPEDFWLRTLTRIVGGGDLPAEDPVKTFLLNVGNAMLMFSWNDGVGWFNCVPLRPALDVVTGGMFHLGFFGVIVHAFKKRTWEAISLPVLIPILLLPSILALAIPNENPSLARAIAAVPAVFLLPALAFVLLIDFMRARLPGRYGAWAAAGLTAALVIAGAVQNFDLTQRQYPATYRLNSENASELGEFMRQFAATIGAPEDAYFIPYPYWVDDRIVNIAAGFPINSVHYVFPEQIPDFEFSGRPTLFLLLAEDAESLEALKQRFPDGYYAVVASQFPNNDFIYFIVPGTPNTGNP
ncbi:MAG: glycosyltransferase family 39 protein [Anaerolineales bacterium]|nr:glycosyltransferase family 39 protein [Anaerolineales bacterium]